MPTAAARFAGLLELVLLVAHHVFYSRNMRGLVRMCLVSKTFRAAAMPYLYRELRILHTAIGIKTKRGLKANLGFVREVFFRDHEVVPAEADLLEEVLSQVPGLETFGYVGTPLAPELVRTLARCCPRLASLSLDIISFCAAPNGPAGVGPSPMLRLDISHFGGLQELALYGLPHNDYGWWLPQLARLLQKSPHLRKLGLGFHARRRALRSDEMVRQYLSALDRLCDLYAETGASPLRLHSLDLLGGLYPYSVDSLQKLTDLSCLHNVYISKMSALHLAGLDLGPVALHAFAPPYAPNLRHFAVDHYDERVHKHVCTLADSHPSFVRSLGVGARAMIPPANTATLLRPSPDHPGLPLRPRMLDLHLDRRLWEDRAVRPDAEIDRCAEQALEDLVASNADSLEGLAVSLRMPDLDPRDPDLLARERNLQLLERVLPRLPNLTQLSVGGVGSDHDTAERLGLASPCLRFVHVGDRFWRVWRNDDGSVTLARIETREASRIELWKYGRITHSPVSQSRWHV